MILKELKIQTWIGDPTNCYIIFNEESKETMVIDPASDVDKIVSDEGYGRNEFVETTKPLVVVTAPGPGSGKLAVCLSQVYHEHKRGRFAGYAKVLF